MALDRLFVVVMAGGSGERFWPLSTPSQPKQFPPLLQGQSFFQQTVDRAIRLVGGERVLIATRRDLLPMVRQQLPGFPEINCVLEPVGRDTAACIGLAACAIERRSADARMLITPSDHAIEPFESFEETIARGLAFLDHHEALLTLGIPPTGPETGYGYILAGDPIPDFPYVLRCQRFTEKPDRATAERFVADGRYYWNSGIFLWSPSALLKAVATHLPAHWRTLSRIREAMGSAAEQAVLDTLFPTLPKVSIDVGVMEPASNVAMLPATFRWDDIGTWAALGRILTKDPDGNGVVGQHIGRDTRDCVIYATSKRIATIGLRDLIVVETSEGILVCPIARAQEVKDLVRRIREENG